MCAYPPDRRLCPVFVLKYLNRTEAIRGNKKCLFISYVKPYGPVSKDSKSRWLKSVMILAGVDCSVYKPHSIRSALKVVWFQ